MQLATCKLAIVLHHKTRTVNDAATLVEVTKKIKYHLWNAAEWKWGTWV
jgi:hypothetical protein